MTPGVDRCGNRRLWTNGLLFNGYVLPSDLLDPAEFDIAWNSSQFAKDEEAQMNEDLEDYDDDWDY